MIADTLRRLFRPSLSCEQVNQFILDYLDGALDARTRKRFEAHMAACPDCSPYLDQYVQTVELLREQGEAAPAPPAALVEHTLAFLREHLDGAAGDAEAGRP